MAGLGCPVAVKLQRCSKGWFLHETQLWNSWVVLSCGCGASFMRSSYEVTGLCCPVVVKLQKCSKGCSLQETQLWSGCFVLSCGVSWFRVHPHFTVSKGGMNPHETSVWFPSSTWRISQSCSRLSPLIWDNFYILKGLDASVVGESVRIWVSAALFELCCHSGDWWCRGWCRNAEVPVHFAQWDSVCRAQEGSVLVSNTHGQVAVEPTKGCW